VLNLLDAISLIPIGAAVPRARRARHRARTRAGRSLSLAMSVRFCPYERIFGR
jgi:hypothetical protein